ncbi:MAG: protein-glutamate O-methyltransferase CheR [Planctomycetes bacterium]|nr:protein-glutamate O-methyltransferase CheR [Planctomycetota bacterium]
MPTSVKSKSLADIELELLLEGVFRRYGFDFRDYAPASLKRRISTAMRAEALSTISELQNKVLHDPDCMERLVLTLSINVTSLFRDPSFYAAFRQKVVPLLRTYPFIRVWHAGCATGEEVYSLAILLEEAGLYERARIYATDMNDAVLRQAQSGIYPLKSMKEYTANYQKAGGTRSFSEYYTAKYDHALLRPALRKNIVFSAHNLATEGSFNEFNVILCRNVLIYFNQTLQERVLTLFRDSLVHFGILALGRKESLRTTTHEDFFEPLDAGERLYRRVK